MLKCSEQPIEINIGGQIFTTFCSTLFKASNSLLPLLCSSQHDPGLRDSQGRVFIDRNPKYFEMILNILRTDGELILPKDKLTRRKLLNEINYYGLGEYWRLYLQRRPVISVKEDISTWFLFEF